MAAHCSICAWKLARTEEPGGPQCVGLQRAGHDRATEHTAQPRLHVRPRTWSSTLTRDADSRVRLPCDGGQVSLGSCEAVWMENTRRVYSSVCVCAHTWSLLHQLCLPTMACFPLLSSGLGSRAPRRMMAVLLPAHGRGCDLGAGQGLAGRCFLPGCRHTLPAGPAATGPLFPDCAVVCTAPRLSRVGQAGTANTCPRPGGWGGGRLGVRSPGPSVPFLGLPSLDTYSSGILCVCVCVCVHAHTFLGFFCSLGLCCSAQAFSGCREQGLHLSCNALASFNVQHGSRVR